MKFFEIRSILITIKAAIELVNYFKHVSGRCSKISKTNSLSPFTKQIQVKVTWQYIGFSFRGRRIKEYMISSRNSLLDSGYLTDTARW